MLEVKVSDGMIMLVKTFRHQKLEERAEKFGGKLNLLQYFLLFHNFL